MTDFEALLIEEQSNPNAALLHMLSISYSTNDIVAFVEGDDDPQFYYDFLYDRWPNNEIIFIKCGNKMGVIAASSDIKDYRLAIQPRSIYYLCDSDFDIVRGIQRSGLTMTKYYSIESYFASVSFVEYLLKRNMSDVIRKSDRDKIINSINTNINMMSKELVIPMAFACHIRKRNLDFDFDKINISMFFDSCSSSVGLKVLPRKLNSMKKGLGSDYLPEELCEIVYFARIMKRMDPREWIRGKLALQLVKYAIAYEAKKYEGIVKSRLMKICGVFGGAALQYGRLYLKSIPGV